MKITNIKIKNFRSIIETEFSPQENISALVGGNESGKSNIILSLINFFSDIPFVESDKHQLSADYPEIEVEFLLSDDEKTKISKFVQGKVASKLVIKKNKSGRSIENIKFKEPNKPPDMSDTTVIDPLPEQNENLDVGAETVENVDTPNQNVEEVPTSETEKTVEVHDDPQEVIYNLLPNLITVLSIEDLITGKDIPIKSLIEAKDSSTGQLSTVNSLLELGGIKLKQLKSTKLSLSQKTKILMKGSSLIGKRLREYWQQEDLKISITTDRKNISIHVRDGGCLPEMPRLKSGLSSDEIKTIENNLNSREDDTRWVWTNPEDRSGGFRWFVTFFAKYLSKVDSGHDTLLMVDDLGVFLNASIQKVLYQKLSELTKDKLQLIYTTHSPYMIDFRDTKNILLVEKKENGTSVIEEWWKKKSLKELPQPLKDIGINRSESILNARNLLVEGATDISVIRRINQIFSPTDDILNTINSVNMYPAGGSGESIGVALYCRVDGKKSAILFDSDHDALSLNQKANSYGLKSKDISTLSMPYEINKFKVESIEDLIPDKLIVTALNIVGTEYLKERWQEIGNVRRKSGNIILGIIPAIKKRLEIDGYIETDIDLIMGSKSAILEICLNRLEIDQYDQDRKVAVENFLKNLATIINSLN